MLKYFPLLDHLGWSDGLDILLVTIIIYRVLLFVQGTRAVEMVLGITALASLYWLSYSYEFYSLNWLLNHFFDYFFLIFIILFQDQIRSALVSFGETRYFRRNKVDNDDEVIEEVIDACGALGRERTGALIVIEKINGLMNFVATGTVLDCQMHSDILYSIFQTKSPLHDGAVIISDGRIKSAGCFLPLSKNVDIDRHLGTRHRAALGITEVSDAVVVIVSEETGRSSICYNGILISVDSEADLRGHLRKLLRASSNIEFGHSHSSGVGP